jgi:hypothetical protein
VYGCDIRLLALLFIFLSPGFATVYSGRRQHHKTYQIIILHLSILLQLALELVFSRLPSTTQQYQDLKFITALNVSAYSAIIR